MNPYNLKIKRRMATVAAFGLLAVGLVAVNVLAGLLPVRIDITEEGLYTLSQGTQNILNGLEEPVTVKFFFNESHGELPVAMKLHARKVRELLEEYDSRSGGQLTLEVIDPKPDSDEEEWAVRYGLQGAQLPTGNRMFLGMVALSAGEEAVIPFFDTARERFLEYDISETISRVNQSKKKTVAILSYLAIEGQMDPRTGQRQGEWALVSELRKLFDVDMVYPANVAEIPESVALLLVIHPRKVTDTIAYALDQFLMRGGRMIVFTDPFSRVDASNPRAMDSQFSSNLAPLFKAWKIKFDHEKVVADLSLATRVNTQQEGVIEYPVWLTFRGDRFNRDSVITSQLEQLTMPDGGAFATEEGFKYTFTPLLTSSNTAGEVDRMSVRMSTPLDLAKNLKPDGTPRVLAALVTGTFDSAFPQGAPPPPMEDDGKGKQVQRKIERKLPHLAVAKQESTVLLVGDSDFIHDRFSVRAVNFFGQKVFQPINDNMSFVLNSVEALIGSQDLIHIRSRGKIGRPFTKVSELQVNAQRRYQAQEEELSSSLEQVRKRLEELESQKKDDKNALISPVQLAEIKKFRMEEVRTKRALREVRKVLRQDIESLGNMLLLLNLLAVPLIVVVLGFVTIIRRSKRSGGGK